MPEVDFFNLIDVGLLIVFLFSVYTGWLKGFITGMLQLMVVAFALLTAFLLYPYLAELLKAHFPALGILTLPLSFLSVLVVARIIVSFLVNQLLHLTPASLHVNVVNRLLGIIPGAINGFIWTVIVAALMVMLPLSDALSSTARSSSLVERLSDKAEWVNDQLSPVFEEVLDETMKRVPREADPETSVTLPFKETGAYVRTDLENKMLVLVNEERAKAGLRALKADPEMQVVARANSRDMFVRGYFAHTNPDGLSPFDRMRKAGVKFYSAGENLALGQTLSICHRGLMNSPGHRANILNPAFGRVGIGILDGGIHGLMITQNFRN